MSKGETVANKSDIFAIYKKQKKKKMTKKKEAEKKKGIAFFLPF